MWLLSMIVLEFFLHPSVFFFHFLYSVFCCYYKFSVKASFCIDYQPITEYIPFQVEIQIITAWWIPFLCFSLLCWCFISWIHRGGFILPKEERFAAPHPFNHTLFWSLVLSSKFQRSESLTSGREASGVYADVCIYTPIILLSSRAMLN